MMPEEDKTPLAGSIEEPAVDAAKDVDGKKRIKPVIEEIASDLPAMKEAKPEHAHEKGRETEPVIEKPAYETLPAPADESKSDIKLFILVAVITAVVVAALAGGIYVYLTGTRNLATPTPTPAMTLPPVSSPEASLNSSPSANLKLSDYKVQILNGSGKIGEANKAKALLTKVGFKVSDTGNAANFNFTDTIIEAKDSVPDAVISSAKDALSSTYSVVIGDKLDPSADFDIVVTIGSK